MALLTNISPKLHFQNAFLWTLATARGISVRAKTIVAQKKIFTVTKRLSPDKEIFAKSQIPEKNCLEIGLNPVSSIY